MTKAPGSPGPCLVREGGVEPPHPFEYTDLNRARLPIPPLALTLFPGPAKAITWGIASANDDLGRAQATTRLRRRTIDTTISPRGSQAAQRGENIETIPITRKNRAKTHALA
jgi:hypothetical protein